MRPPRTTFSDPVFAEPAPGLDGKKRKGKYSDHNPVFTRHALANETLMALEATLPRVDQWKQRVRGRYGDMHLALVAQDSHPTLEAMRDVWQQRERDVAQPESPKGECQSWADVGGKKVCAMDEFWVALGRKQAIEQGPVRIDGCVPLAPPFPLALKRTS